MRMCCRLKRLWHIPPLLCRVDQFLLRLFSHRDQRYHYLSLCAVDSYDVRYVCFLYTIRQENKSVLQLLPLPAVIRRFRELLTLLQMDLARIRDTHMEAAFADLGVPAVIRCRVPLIEFRPFAHLSSSVRELGYRAGSIIARVLVCASGRHAIMVNVGESELRGRVVRNGCLPNRAPIWY